MLLLLAGNNDVATGFNNRDQVARKSNRTPSIRTASLPRIKRRASCGSITGSSAWDCLPSTPAGRSAVGTARKRRKRRRPQHAPITTTKTSRPAALMPAVRTTHSPGGRSLAAQGHHRLHGCWPSRWDARSGHVAHQQDQRHPAILHGSCGFTPYRSVLTRRLVAYASSNPAARPAISIPPACRRTIAIKRRRSAPSAIRMPRSRVRCVTQ
jgi:hypothetical protein